MGTGVHVCLCVHLFGIDDVVNGFPGGASNDRVLEGWSGDKAE